MAIDKNIIQSLLNDIESDRAERTISVNNTDKFGQAICAFANDRPNHGKPGYLIIGVDDKTGKETENPSSKFSLSETQRKLFHLLCMNSDITYAELMKQTNLSRSYLSRIISALKEHGYVVRKGSDRAGSWEIRKSLTD